MSEIVQDDEHCFGNPRIEGTNVPVQMIIDRFTAGESTMMLANDYMLSQIQVEEALRYGINTKLNIEDLQCMVREISDGNKVWQQGQIAAVNFFIVALNGESGELANNWKKVLRGDFEMDPDAYAIEAADIINYSLLLMCALKRDAKDAILKKLEIVKKRVEAGGFGERPEEEMISNDEKKS